MNEWKIKERKKERKKGGRKEGRNQHIRAKGKKRKMSLIIGNRPADSIIEQSANYWCCEDKEDSVWRCGGVVIKVEGGELCPDTEAVAMETDQRTHLAGSPFAMLVAGCIDIQQECD